MAKLSTLIKIGLIALTTCYLSGCLVTAAAAGAAVGAAAGVHYSK
jgi:hypothetical protein